jgi:hypothetical protein
VAERPWGECGACLFADLGALTLRSAPAANAPSFLATIAFAASMFDEKRDLKHSGSEEQDHGALHAGQPFETVNEENVGLSSAEKRKLKFKIDSRLLIVIWLMVCAPAHVYSFRS